MPVGVQDIQVTRAEVTQHLPPPTNKEKAQPINPKTAVLQGVGGMLLAHDVMALRGGGGRGFPKEV